jgi:hypothetical protein
VTEGNIKRTRRRRRKLRQLVDDHKENRRYWKSKEEVLIALCGELALEEAMHLM